MRKYNLRLEQMRILESVHEVISKLGMMLCVCMCCGCYTLPLWTPSCSHTDQPVFEFKNFDDGHHFLFHKDSSLAASVNTKTGYPQGKFEIYYNTGILKYWGMLDDRGHVVSGRYNTYGLSFDDYNIRKMTVADEQNAQTELDGILREGIRRNDVRKPDALQVKTVTDKENVKLITESLFNCSQSTFHPVIGNVYQHDGKGLRIFQSIESAVMVKVDALALDRLDMRVDTKTAYVDGEMLKPGRYEYIGPYTYETIGKQVRTIRRFRQVK